MTTKPNTDCKSTGWCHYDGPARTKFFHGMLLTDEHLRLEQSYHRHALGRLHRYLWGPGIVCGFEVEWIGGVCVKVHAGLAVDCHGNAIELCTCLTIDIGEECKKKFPGGCAPSDAKAFTRHLVIRYASIEDDPQPVLTTSDECGGGTACETSRVREGFCLELVDECPKPCRSEEEKGQEKSASQQQALQGLPPGQTAPEPGLSECMSPPRPCPPCECECGCGAIGLATLTIDCKAGTIVVDCTCRHESQFRRDARTEERSELQMAKRIEELERQLRDLTYKLVGIAAADDRLERLEVQARSFVPAAAVEQLRHDVAQRAPAEEVETLKKYLEGRLKSVDEEIAKRVPEDRIKTIEERLEAQAGAVDRSIAAEAKVGMLSDQLLSLVQKRPAGRGKVDPAVNP